MKGLAAAHTAQHQEQHITTARSLHTILRNPSPTSDARRQEANSSEDNHRTNRAADDDAHRPLVRVTECLLGGLDGFGDHVGFGRRDRHRGGLDSDARHAAIRERGLK